jgi:1,2-phenylacetyl-CoA epoxidase catalytic subunit
MAGKKISTFDDWKELFFLWRKGLGYDDQLFSSIAKDYPLDAKFSDLVNGEVEFGDFAGKPKWKNASDVPGVQARDLLLRLITVQGDAEFAAVEQQRELVDKAPSTADLESLLRIHAEEMRQGWQMSYLLVNYFGRKGGEEAGRLMERSAARRERLQDAFNQPIVDWLDLFVYLTFVDRAGIYELRMLSRSGFARLATSAGPMIEEESSHLLIGLTGLRRILRAKRIPIRIVQKLFNRWLPVSFDLFGHEHCKIAAEAYRWGLKGGLDPNQKIAKPETLNESARLAYHEEVKEIVDALNQELGEEEALYVPDLKFNRSIG